MLDYLFMINLLDQSPRSDEEPQSPPKKIPHSTEWEDRPLLINWKWIKRYFVSAQFAEDICPLDFYKSNSTDYLVLAKLAS